MPHVHYLTEFEDGVGAAAGALQPLATLRTSSKATDLCAFVLGKANSGVRTTAESHQGQFLINTGDLSENILKIQSSMGDGGGPVTQSQGLVEYPKWVPFKPRKSDVSNKPIIFQYDTTIPDSTAVYCAQASIVFAEGTYPTDVMTNVETLQTPITWADSVTEPDIGNAVQEVFPDTITVPGWVKEIVAIGITYTADAILTTAQHWVGYVEITGTIPGLFPMQIPLPTIHGALAGVVVGGCVVCHEYILPMYIEHKSEYPATLTFTANIEAIHSLGQIEITLYGR